MDATKNTRYQISSNSSPFSLAMHYNNFVQDIARTIPYNLLVNSQFIDLNIAGNLTVWSVSGTAIIGGYNASLYRSITLGAGSSIYQNVYNSYTTNQVHILPNTNYTIILYSNTPVTGFALEVIPVSANQIFNVNDYTQVNLIDYIQIPASGSVFYKNILQFSTASSATLTGPLQLHIKNTNAVSGTINLGYIALYEGLVEYSYLPDKYNIDITLETGSAATPSLNYINNLNTGMFSPNFNSIAWSINGIQEVTISNAGNFLINTTTDDGYNSLQVSGSGKFYNNLTVLGNIYGNNGYFTGTVSGINAYFSQTLSGNNLFSTSSVSGLTGNFSTSVTSPHFIGNADTATSATSAGYSTYSGSGNYATYSGSGNYATNSATANYSINSGYAANAGNAAYATNSYHANTADTANTASVANALSYNPIPPGTILIYTGYNQPSGTLKANGAAVSRTVYSKLFNVIGTIYGGGDGSTTFNLPDYRGLFVRGYDDGRGLDSWGGRPLGSYQADQFAIHNHLFPADDQLITAGGLRTVWGIGYDAYSNFNWHGAAMCRTSDTGGAETNPRNISALFCIAY